MNASSQYFATHWTARVWYGHNQRWLQASKEGAEASKSGSFKDERAWGRKCFEDLDQRRMGRPATSTWSTDFLLREGSSREEIGKWLKNKSIPWQRRRRLLTSADPAGYATVWRQRVNSDTQQSTQNDSDNSFVRSVTAEWDEEREGLFHTATRSRVAGRNRLGHKDLS